MRAETLKEGFSVDGDARRARDARWMTTMRRVEWMERYSLRRFRARLASRVASATKRGMGTRASRRHPKGVLKPYSQRGRRANEGSSRGVRLRIDD